MPKDRQESRSDEGRATRSRTPPTMKPPQARSIRYVTLPRGVSLAYLLRISARARMVRLVIRPESGLEVVAPRGTSQARIEQVLAEKARWIETTLARVARESVAEEPREIADGAELPLAGRGIRLALRVGALDGHFRARLDGDTLTLWVARADQETIRAALDVWYRRQARVLFAERLAVCNAGYGFSYGRVAIKEQKSRWGSCSRKGNLNFNWRLVLAPLAVLDYVVIHELCHLRELNHSPRFWALVARGCPDYATQRRWLREHGRGLHL